MNKYIHILINNNNVVILKGEPHQFWKLKSVATTLKNKEKSGGVRLEKNHLYIFIYASV